MGWLCEQCCDVTFWTGVSVLQLACVGGVHTDLYSSCTRTDSSSSASVWGRAQWGNLHLLSLSACFYHHWGNASLPDLTVSDLCCMGKKSNWAIRKLFTVTWQTEASGLQYNISSENRRRTRRPSQYDHAYLPGLMCNGDLGCFYGFAWISMHHWHAEVPLLSVVWPVFYGSLYGIVTWCFFLQTSKSSQVGS